MTLLAVVEPALFLLAAAAACLVLEAAGTPVGARKRGPRTHLCLVALFGAGAVVAYAATSWSSVGVLGTGRAAGLVLDRLALFGAALVAIIVATALVAAVAGLRALGEERGEIYALALAAGASLVALVGADDVVVVAGAALVFRCAAAALASVEREAPHAVEAAVKGVVAGGASLAVLAMGGALAYGATGAATITAAAAGAAAQDPVAIVALLLVSLGVLSLLGVVPLHGAFVDQADGAPPFAAAMTSAGALVAGGVLAVRLVSAALAAATPPDRALLGDGLAIASVVTLVVLAAAAVDQVRVARLVAYLAASQAALPLAALASSSSDPRAALVAATASLVPTSTATLGALLALGFLRRPGQGGGTWEDWSGAGRVHPVAALVLLFLLGSLAGAPGTGGFLARVEVAEVAFRDGRLALGAAVLIVPVVAVAPVLRLGLFLFSKTPDPRFAPQTSTWRSAAVLLAALGVATAGAWPAWMLRLVGSAL